MIISEQILILRPKLVNFRLQIVFYNPEKTENSLKITTPFLTFKLAILEMPFLKGKVFRSDHVIYAMRRKGSEREKMFR